MFSEDMFDACVIELQQLIAGLDQTRICELWHVSSIDRKSMHFVVLFDDTMHLCTCLTLINRGLVCRHFFATMLVFSLAKFHVGLVPRRWYTNTSVIEADVALLNTPAISVLSNDGFGAIEHVIHIDLSHLESIHGRHVFTKEVCQEMTRKQQWGRGFGIMKKALNLAIETGRIEEIYKMHEDLVKQMENEVTQAVQGSNITEFAHTINNPISIKTKGRKPKNSSKTNADCKGKKRQIRFNDNNKENDSDDEDHEESSHKRLRKALKDNSNADNAGM